MFTPNWQLFLLQWWCIQKEFAKLGMNRYAEGNLCRYQNLRLKGFLRGWAQMKKKKSAFAEQAISPSIHLYIQYFCVIYFISWAVGIKRKSSCPQKELMTCWVVCCAHRELIMWQTLQGRYENLPISLSSASLTTLSFSLATVDCCSFLSSPILSLV